ncbi:MAG: M67 family metallopeptidase [Thermaerobacterales bacterium]
MIEIPQSMLRAMVEHARRHAPIEACGLVAGRGKRATRFFPTPNTENSPVRYAVPPLEILNLSQAMEAAGEELLGIFHSHPATEAYPSQTDLRLAFYPDACYMILSLAGPQPVLRGYYIRNAAALPEKLTIVCDRGESSPTP